ncbi:MAG: YjcQ family protein [Oscillospiraceae bacterium]
MAKDDIFRIIYTILKELYAHRKDGTQVPREDISPERFQIADSYWISIICELSDNGYISGVKCRETKTGKVVSGIDDMDVTLKGIEYLQDNSEMKRVHNLLKGIKDIMPGI